MSTSFGGCLGDRIIPNNENSMSISVPIWTKGLFWDYSVKTQEIETSTTMIVAEDSNSTDYSVGTSSLMDAKQHAVLNHNPAIGRVKMSDLSTSDHTYFEK